LVVVFDEDCGVDGEGEGVDPEFDGHGEGEELDYRPADEEAERAEEGDVVSLQLVFGNGLLDKVMSA
jgi:hypothetical protein